MDETSGLSENHDVLVGRLHHIWIIWGKCLIFLLVLLTLICLRVTRAPMDASAAASYPRLTLFMDPVLESCFCRIHEHAWMYHLILVQTAVTNWVCPKFIPFGTLTNFGKTRRNCGFSDILENNNESPAARIFTAGCRQITLQKSR